MKTANPTFAVIADLFIKYLNGHDDNMSFVSVFHRHVSAGEPREALISGIENVLNHKLYDLVGGMDAVNMYINEFKSNL